MDFVANDPYVVFCAQRRHGIQFVTGPYFAGWVLRAAQQQHAVLRLGKRGFQPVHIAEPLAVLFRQRHADNLPLIAFNGFKECVVGWRVNHDTIARCGPLANHLGNHINDRRSVNDAIGINRGMKTVGEPVGNRG